jgi:acetyl-CoA carboxylase carboxyl transferase subunit beta
MRNLFRKDPPYIAIPAVTRPAASTGSFDFAQDGHESGDGLWVRCPNERCRELLYVREFENNLKVCHKCEHHARLSAHERIQQLVDPGTFDEQDADLASGDPLGFVAAGDTYVDKLQETASKTGTSEAAVGGPAIIECQPCELVVLEFGFMGASMGAVVGEKVARAAERAATSGTALVTVNASGGARMHEGIFALLQMSKTVTALRALADAGVPHLAVLTDPTLGGVLASYAGIADVVIAEEGALVGFAGPRVIEQVTKQKLPPEAQRPPFLLEHGLVDLVVHRRELRATLGRLLRLYGARGVGRGSHQSRRNGRVRRGA